MSARIPVGTAEIWLQFNVAADPEAMYCALAVDLADSVAATQTLTDQYLTAAIAAIDQAVSSDYSLGPGHVVWGQDGADLRLDGTSAPVQGTGTASSLPQNCAVLVRKVTSSGGRRGRGRMYFPGIAEGSVTNVGALTGAMRTTWQTAMDALRNDLIANSTIDNVVLLHDSAPFTPTVITSLEVQPVIATQRRRMRP